MINRFDSEQDAAFYLLQDSAITLNEFGVKFVIMGGWVPFLFHAERYPHPGTFDVDILLHSRSLDDGTFESAAEALLARGYLRAVKNKFQAHRILRVGDEDFVFHVDFLNERAADNELELVTGTGRMHSIYTPTMRAVFDYNNFRTHPSTDGILFPSVETFIASKAAAALVKKRRRDAFDIFVSLADQQALEFRNRWQVLVERDGLFRDANDALWKAIYEEEAVEKILSILTEVIVPTIPSRELIIETFSFLDAPVNGSH